MIKGVSLGRMSLKAPVQKQRNISSRARRRPCQASPSWCVSLCADRRTKIALRQTGDCNLEQQGGQEVRAMHV